MTYTLLPEILRGIILVFTTLILFVYFYCMVKMIYLGRINYHFVVTALLSLVTFILYQLMIWYQTSYLALTV